MSWNLPVVGLGFFYALIPTAIGYLFYYRGVQQMRESSKVPVLASMETVTAAMIGVCLLGEQLGLWHYLGIIIVMISIVLMQHKGPGSKKATNKRSKWQINKR